MVLRHEISTPDCKNINQTRAVLIFKIAKPNGAIQEKRIDVSLDELRQFKTELQRIEETLAWVKTERLSRNGKGKHHLIS